MKRKKDLKIKLTNLYETAKTIKYITNGEESIETLTHILSFQDDIGTYRVNDTL